MRWHMIQMKTQLRRKRKFSNRVGKENKTFHFFLHTAFKKQGIGLCAKLILSIDAGAFDLPRWKTSCCLLIVSILYFYTFFVVSQPKNRFHSVILKKIQCFNLHPPTRWPAHSEAPTCTPQPLRAIALREVSPRTRKTFHAL